MAKVTLAVLITCYNRKEKTLVCLERLMSQENLDGVSINVFLVDDGSTDDTGESVAERFPDVNVLLGSGALYWCGGMRLAFEAAMFGDFDYYLWLNDDVVLFKNALKRLLDTMKSLGNSSAGEGIVVGSMCDADTGRLTYGGFKNKHPLRPLNLQMMQPGRAPLECDVANGNLVLIPNSIVSAVGNLSEEYTHGMGDFDYCLRVRKAGYAIWIAPGFFGNCSRNSIRNSCRDGTLSLKERREKLKQPTSLPPAKEWMTFVRQHGGVFWPIDWLRTLLRQMFPSVWVLLRSSNYNTKKGAWSGPY